MKNVSFSVNEGEFLALVGANGSGKSTLAKHLNGLLLPRSGNVFVFGHNTKNDKDIYEIRKNVGVVFQNPTLFPWLTVEKNIAFSLDVRGMKDGKAERVDQMIRMIGLERFRNDYPAQLSGGMAQRVALVRTLINEPEILLLDEPLGALDEFTRMNMQDEILNIWAQKKQLALMVTHSIDEAVYMGTRVLVMESNPGRIVADIRIDEDFPRDRSSASFVEYRNEILNRLHFGGKKTE